MKKYTNEEKVKKIKKIKAEDKFRPGIKKRKLSQKNKQKYVYEWYN